LAYLFARATDTIADTAEISASERTAFLTRLAAAIQEGRPELLEDFPKRFARLQNNRVERALIDELRACFRALSYLSVKDRDDVRAVLARINEGQSLDVARFGDPTKTVALETVEELHHYTYLVAGSVGEFWTALCARHLKAFAGREVEEMNALGIRYGRGLQLINILRDTGSDLRAGRCYLPAEEMARAHVDMESIFANRQRFMVVHERWQLEAMGDIAAGIEYATAIKNRRVRIATALPALIGARTLALIRDARTGVLDRNIKISRKEIRAIIGRLTATLASARTIAALFRRLRA